MALPKAIDFSNLSQEYVFNSDSKQYKLLNKIPDDKWSDYCNQMLGKGTSVTYNAEADCFTAKPQKLKVKESLMSGNKKILLEQGDKVRFRLNKDEIGIGTIQWINEDESYDILLADGSVVTCKDEVEQGKKLYEANHRFKKPLTEDEKKALLYDQDDEEDNEDEPEEEGNLPEETSTKEDELESELEDEEEPDFDTEISSMADGIDEPEEQVVDNTMNSMEAKGVSVPGVVSMDDLEAMLTKILGKVNSQENKPQYPNSEAQEVQKTVPDLGKGPQANVLITDFSDTTDINTKEDDATLNSTYGHGSPLEGEFPEIGDKVSAVQSKIGGESTFDTGTPSALAAGGSLEVADTEEIPDMYNQRSDGFEGSENYLLDDSDFERNAELAGGLGAYDTSEEIGDIFEETGDPEPLPSVSANAPVGPAQPTNSLSVNKTVQCAGIPIQIVLTGVMLTMRDIGTIAESVKKQGLFLKRIESSDPSKLDIIVEAKGKRYRVKYEDIAKYRNQSPFSIKHEKFQSLTEACQRINLIAQQQTTEKKNFVKYNDKEILSRPMTNTKESTLLKEFEGKTNYISTWNVKAMGSINLKTGINEAYSNITTSSKEANTLIKTKDGQFYLLKGNRKERSKVGVIKELVDLEGKKAYGIGKVMGVYENTSKGLGQVMYHTKRTSLPLLIWK
jgi:hypothetical protein